MNEKVEVPKYSLGFAFSANGQELVVITKNRPAWQAGKWNGVGGSIEPGETPLQCQVREFCEETGVKTIESDWKPICQFSSEHFAVHTFCLFSDCIYDVKTLTDEQVSIIPVDLNQIRLFGQSNLPWLVGLCLDKDQPRLSVNATYQAA
ncbi:MAG: NUDIX domain-containing protein [Hafnia sp.]